MRPPRLSLVLVLVITGLVVAATGALAWSESRILARIAEDAAVANARAAAASVVDGLQREQDDVASAARLLAERPTLERLLGPRDPDLLRSFLDRFRDGTGVDGCAILAGGAPLAVSGTPVPADVLAFASSRRRAVARIDSDAGRALVVGFAEVPGVSDAVVVVSEFLSPAPLEAPSSEPRPAVAVLGRDAIGRDMASPRSGLRNAALTAGGIHAGRVGDALVAVAGVRSGGEIVGVVEAEVPRAVAAMTVRRWVRTARTIALTVVGIGVLAGFLLGRRVANPLQALSQSAERIGLGDLETPVPRAPGREAGTLARVMEEMRLRLLDAAAQIRRSQAESEAVLGGIGEGVFGVDEERRIRYVNPRAARLLGVDAREAEGTFCGDMLRPEEEDGERPCENRCPILRSRAGATSYAIERIRGSGGSVATVVLTSSPPVEGRQIQVMRQETEVEATRRLRDTVVANISHEFKTPLAAQLASIELLRDRLDALSPTEARDLVLSMERGAVRLARLVDNLLESARLESGERGIRRVPVDLDDVVEEAVEAMRPLLEQKGQALEIDLPHPLPAVLGDAPRLTQVFVNLLANAHKFAPAGSTIRVGGSTAAGSVTLFVADEGPGLPDGEEVFGRFVRRAGDEPEQSGLGLGLWISKSIVERHGGHIWSDPVPSGTTMCVALPEAPREDPRRG
jgi:signal transduction histidine kinase/HAMP domain-containing protein